jgi:protein-S-isoprenylcysteine O-methyltransferase Ste14
MISKLRTQVAIFAALGVLLLVSAGTWRWPAAWVLIAELAATGIGLNVWLGRHDPALLAERSSSYFQSSQPPWDKAILAASLIASSGLLVLLALDAARFRWSHVPMSLQVVGAILVLLNGYFAYLAFRENTYAAAVVKVQTERGHRVVSTGPYAYVRHPMYVGVMLLYIGVPLLLGSWYGLAAALVCMGILAMRVVREERALAVELAGYREYAERVRYRLVPGLW